MRLSSVGGALASLAGSSVGVGSWLASVVGNGVVDFGSRQARQWRLKKAVRADLLLALLAARLSAVAYVESQAKVRDALRAPEFVDVFGEEGLELLHFKRQRAEDRSLHPQWFLARGAPPYWTQMQPYKRPRRSKHGEPPLPLPTALYLVFRGTWSKMDLIRDLCVEPTRHDGRMFHGGFLSGVRDDRELHSQLRKHLGHGCDHLYVCGHSLGGSLGFSLVAANLLPHEYALRS